jgi:hypothetical protein
MLNLSGLPDDPRIAKAAAYCAGYMDRALARMGYEADAPFRRDWMETSGDSPLVHARVLAEGFDNPPADLICAQLLLRPCFMADDFNPDWVAMEYGPDVHEKLSVLLNFFSVCEKPEELAQRLKEGPAEARLVRMSRTLDMLRASHAALQSDPAEATDYGLRRAGTDAVIEACRGTNARLEAKIDESRARIWQILFPPVKVAAAPRPAPG